MIEMQNEVVQVVSHLNAAMSNIRLYTANHPQVVRYIDLAHGALQALLEQREELTLITVDDDLVVDHQTINAKSPQLNQFVRILKQSAVERITFTREASLAELAQLVKELVASDRDVVRSTEGILLGKVRVVDHSDLVSQVELLPEEVKQRLGELMQLRDRSLDDLKEMYRDIQKRKRIPTKGVGDIVQGFISGMLRNTNPLHMLASLKSSDEYTFTHAINVCLLTMAQAESLGASGDQLHDIGIAACLHDAGKMFIPNEILNKPGKLDEHEWAEIRGHSLRGAQYLLRLPGISKLTFLGALEHHLHYNGAGYPDLGKQWRPNLVSQMIAVSDLFDAMRSRRPYKEPRPDDFILELLRKESGTAYNPQLVENFIQLIESSPDQ
ncbi:MAG: HD domain-containing protein [Desulfobacteraceae bacterium]|jgi:HD-GYP domain-containing protein (c-di-GMP phosphodiesterase class II)